MDGSQARGCCLVAAIRGVLMLDGLARPLADSAQSTDGGASTSDSCLPRYTPPGTADGPTSVGNCRGHRPTKGGALSSEELELGPIDIVVIGFPPDAPRTGEAIPIFVDLVDRGIIRVLDVLVVQKDAEGTVLGLAIARPRR